MQRVVSGLYRTQGLGALPGVSSGSPGRGVTNLPPLPCPASAARIRPPWSPARENQTNPAINPRGDQPGRGGATRSPGKGASPPSHPRPPKRNTRFTPAGPGRVCVPPRGRCRRWDRRPRPCAATGPANWEASATVAADCTVSPCSGAAVRGWQRGSVSPPCPCCVPVVVPTVSLLCARSVQTQMPRTGGVCWP